MKKLKLLLHGINFAPEPTGIGKYTGEMAAGLAKAGHEVRVVTAPPYYPEWKVPGSVRNAYSTETWQGVRVWRAPLYVPARPTGRTRVLHLLSFALSAVPSMVRQWAWRPDVVLVVAPAITSVPFAWLTARVTGAKAWLHVQDFEVDAAYQLGLLNSAGKRRGLVTTLERWLLRRFEVVSSITRPMLARAREKGVDPARLVYLPNWVDADAITPLSRPSAYRERLGLPAGAKVALFSGTMGGKQGLDILPMAARLLAHREDFWLVICGDGVMKPQIEALCAGLPRVLLLPLQPADQLNELLGLADIHLLPQNPQAADLVMPSKLTGMLASGRPVVTTAHPGTELATVVAQCGIVTPPGDPRALASAIEQLLDDDALRQRLGGAARQHGAMHLSCVAILQRLESELLRLGAGEQPGRRSPPNQGGSAVANEITTDPDVR